MKLGEKSYILMMVLVLCASCSFALDLKWDVGADPNNQVGDGIWDTTNTNWWDSASQANVNWMFGDTALFDAGDGSLYTVTLNEDIDLEKATFVENTNCQITGANSLTLYGDSADSLSPAVLAKQNSSITIDNDLYRHESADSNYGDPEIRVAGGGTRLTLNGDMYTTEYNTVTEDIVFTREDTGTDYVEIEMNGNIFNDADNAKINIRGWNPDNFELAGTRLIMNGDLHTYENDLRLHPGAWLEVGGRMEANLIHFFPKNTVNNFADMPSVLEGSDGNTGIWAVTTAGYGGKYIKRRAADSYGKIYAVHLNLEVDVTGLDFNTGTNEYTLAELSARMRWFGSLNSYYAKEPAGTVGTVISMINMPEPGESTTQNVLFAVETADLENDGIVDYKDFANWAQQYGSSSSLADDWKSGRDFDHNGGVDPNDVGRFASKWLAGN